MPNEESLRWAITYLVAAGVYNLCIECSDAGNVDTLAATARIERDNAYSNLRLHTDDDPKLTASTINAARKYVRTEWKGIKP